MELNLCMGCMRKKQLPGPCPHCGFDERAYQPYPRHLPLYTILNGKYLVGKVLGEGGFGITYLGYDLNLQMKVAIKEYYLNGYASRELGASCRISVMTGEKGEYFRIGLQRFLEEARRLARFWSLPGIVSVKDYFQENNTAYIVMEFIEGKTLKQMLEEAGGKLEPVLVFEMMEPVMESLKVIHQSGLIHRDITPENIMVEPQGTARLIDFGASKDFFNGEEGGTSLVVKPGYAPVEQYQSNGQMGPWTDIYGLCASIYRAITGQIPIEALTRQTRDTLKKPSQLNVVISRSQEKALMKGLACARTDRFQSIEEFQAAIADHASGRDNHGIKFPLAVVGTGIVVALCLTGMAWLVGKALKSVTESVSPQPGLTAVSVPEQNVLMEDEIDIFEEDEEWLVLGSSISRNDIISIHFEDSLDKMGADSWDVSADGSGNVMAWTKPNGRGYDLYIAGEGGVKANLYSNSLFACYKNLEAIQFNQAFDTSEVMDMGTLFFDCGSLTKLDLTEFDTSNVMNMDIMFAGCDSLSQLEFGKFDTSQVQSMIYMFLDCSSLTELDVSGFDTAQVANMAGMFCSCSRIAELDVTSFDTSRVTDMAEMFRNCSRVAELDLSGFDTSQVMDLSSMFEGCSSLAELDLSNFDTSQVANLYSMFDSCSNLKKLDIHSFDTSEVMDMSFLFNGCENLDAVDVSGFDTSEVWDMSGMFKGCNSLTELDVSGFDTSQVQDMSYMFMACNSLTKLDVSRFDTANVADMSNMFSFCNNLTELDLHDFDFSKVEDVSYMFYQCSSLEQLVFTLPNLEEFNQTENMLTGTRWEDSMKDEP